MNTSVLKTKADILTKLKWFNKNNRPMKRGHDPCYNALGKSKCTLHNCVEGLRIVGTGAKNKHLLPQVITTIKETKQPHHFRTVKSARKLIQPLFNQDT